MIGNLAHAANRFEGSTKIQFKFEGDKTNIGRRATTLTEVGTVVENSIVNPMGVGTYCATPLNGSNYYNTDLIQALSNQGDFSLDCEFYTADLAARRYIISWARSGFSECWWGVETDGKMGYGYNGGLAYGTLTPAGAVTSGAWHHLMVRVYSGNSKTDMFVDGVRYPTVGQDMCCGLLNGTIGSYRLGGGGTFAMKNLRICIPSMIKPRRMG